MRVKVKFMAGVRVRIEMRDKQKGRKAGDRVVQNSACFPRGGLGFCLISSCNIPNKTACSPDLTCRTLQACRGCHTAAALASSPAAAALTCSDASCRAGRACAATDARPVCDVSPCVWQPASAPLPDSKVRKGGVACKACMARNARTVLDVGFNACQSANLPFPAAAVAY